MTIAEREEKKDRQYIRYNLRPMQPQDSGAYAQLMATSPERGLIAIQTIFKIDPYEMLLQRRIGEMVVVAETPDGQVVGSGAYDARPIWFEQQPVQAVHLHSIMVHPDYRRRGLATAITQWRIQDARQKYGDGTVIFAEIQQNDLAAFKNASKWATGFGQQREVGFLPVRKKPPADILGVLVREATMDDFPEIAEDINEFNRDINFTRYVTVDRLRRNLEPIHGQVFRHRYVVENKGKIVGGAVLSSHDPSVETRVIRAPFIARLYARLTGMIHTDGVVNGGEVDGIWFRPGYEDTTHYLVELLRYRASQETQALNFRVTNPKAWEALQVARWQPHTIYSVAYLRPAALQPYTKRQTGKLGPSKTS